VAQLFSLGIMDATPKMQGQPVGKWRVLMQLAALFVFFIICSDFSLSVVMKTGAEQSQICKLAFFLLVFCRLAWQIYKHTFRFLDCIIYIVIVFGFCYWVDHQVIQL
jgi:hypothetical protein